MLELDERQLNKHTLHRELSDRVRRINRDAIECAVSLAIDGDPKAAYVLGRLLDCGVTEITLYDKPAAMDWYDLSAECGYPLGVFWRAAHLHKRRTNIKDVMRLWKRAANDGYAAAMSNLGVLPLRQDKMEEAQAWLTKAFEKEQGMAAHALGWHSERKDNHADTRQWYLKTHQM